MYITLGSIKRNLGLFNLELIDIILAGVYALVFIILFALGFYQTGLIILLLGIFSLIPISFSKQNRMYKLVLLVGSFLLRRKTFYYHLEDEEVRRDRYNTFIKNIKERKN